MDDYSHNDDELNLRKNREEHPASNVHIFIQWWLIPGIIGVAVSMFLGKIALGLAMSMPRNEPINSSLKRIMGEINQGAVHLVKLEWSKTDLWVYILVGFLIGVVIKYAYSDERIG